MPPKQDRKSKPTLVEKVTKYNEIDYKIKTLTKKLIPIKEELKALVDAKGYVTPAGSKRLEVGNYELVNTLRSGTALVPEATILIEKYLPELASKLIQKVSTVREDKLKQMITDGLISTRVARRLYQITESFAFSIKEQSDEK